jgi:hypothetical protein
VAVAVVACCCCCAGGFEGGDDAVPIFHIGTCTTRL